jgi:hypothetical protein
MGLIDDDAPPVSQEHHDAVLALISTQVARKIQDNIVLGDNVPTLAGILCWTLLAHMAESALRSERPDLLEQFDRVKEALTTEGAAAIAVAAAQVRAQRN